LKSLELVAALGLTTQGFNIATPVQFPAGFGLQTVHEDDEMKTIVKLLLSGALALILPAVAVAQIDQIKSSTPEQRAEMQDKWMQNNLSLDAKTLESASAINLKYARETQALVTSDASKLKMLTTFRKNSHAKGAELKAIFTPEQYSQYKQKKAEMKAQIKEKLQEKHQTAQASQ
jgi:hypothetical protein